MHSPAPATDPKAVPASVAPLDQEDREAKQLWREKGGWIPAGNYLAMVRDAGDQIEICPDEEPQPAL